MQITMGSAPNKAQQRFATAATTFKLLGGNGTVYASLAAARAASTDAWPVLPSGMKPQTWMIVGAASDGYSQAAGSILVHLGGATAPSDDTTSTPLFPGSSMSGVGPVPPIWVRTLTSSDLVYVMVEY